MAARVPRVPKSRADIFSEGGGAVALAQATCWMPAMTQPPVPLTGLVVTKLDGTSKGGMVVAIQKELALPVKFIGVGEQPDDLQPFDPKQFADALFMIKS